MTLAAWLRLGSMHCTALFLGFDSGALQPCNLEGFWCLELRRRGRRGETRTKPETGMSLTLCVFVYSFACNHWPEWLGWRYLKTCSTNEQASSLCIGRYQGSWCHHGAGVSDDAGRSTEPTNTGYLGRMPIRALPVAVASISPLRTDLDA